VHLIVRSVSSAATVPPFLIFYKEIGIMLFSQSTFASPVPINTSIIENKSYKTINAAPPLGFMRCFAFFLQKQKFRDYFLIGL